MFLEDRWEEVSFSSRPTHLARLFPFRSPFLISEIFMAHFFFFLNIFIEVQLLHNGVLVSALQQSKSATHTHMFPYLLPLASPSHPPYPTPLGGHKAPS